MQRKKNEQFQKNGQNNADTKRYRSLTLCSFLLFFFLNVIGQHPFGDVYEREMNIIKGQYNIDLLKDQPEALALVRSMIHTIPEKR